MVGARFGGRGSGKRSAPFSQHACLMPLRWWSLKGQWICETDKA